MRRPRTVPKNASSAKAIMGMKVSVHVCPIIATCSVCMYIKIPITLYHHLLPLLEKPHMFSGKNLKVKIICCELDYFSTETDKHVAIKPDF